MGKRIKLTRKMTPDEVRVAVACGAEDEKDFVCRFLGLLTNIGNSGFSMR